MKTFLAVAALLAMVSSASAGAGNSAGRNARTFNYPHNTGGSPSHTRGRIPHNQGGIYDRWGNGTPGFLRAKHHNYRGTVTLVR